jgi:hypothetical protein
MKNIERNKISTASFEGFSDKEYFAETFDMIRKNILRNTDYEVEAVEAINTLPENQMWHSNLSVLQSTYEELTPKIHDFGWKIVKPFLIGIGLTIFLSYKFGSSEANDTERIIYCALLGGFFSIPFAYASFLGLKEMLKKRQQPVNALAYRLRSVCGIEVSDNYESVLEKVKYIVAEYEKKSKPIIQKHPKFEEINWVNI